MMKAAISETEDMPMFVSSWLLPFNVRELSYVTGLRVGRYLGLCK